MNWLYVTHFLNGFLMILMPVLLGVYLARRFRLGWRLWWIGAGTFILSQVGHIPFNAVLGISFERGLLPAPPENYQLAFSALVLGLSAGLWEESARYLAYRFWAKDARSWSQGLVMGAGHGGIESILVGLLVLANYVGRIIFRDVDLASVLPPEQIALAQQQLQAYWSMSWYDPLLGAAERLSALTFHLSASLLVLQVFARGKIRWLWLAIGWHSIFNAVAVFAVGTWGPYVTEALIGLCALFSLGMIFWLRPPNVNGVAPVAPDEGPLPPPADATGISLPDVEETPDNLDQTRYT
jgi:uncharacterized membrane protein YhfC